MTRMGVILEKTRIENRRRRVSLVLLHREWGRTKILEAQTFKKSMMELSIIEDPRNYDCRTKPTRKVIPGTLKQSLSS